MKIGRERLDRRWAENGPDTVEEKSQYSFKLSRARAAYLFFLLNISTWLVMLFFSDLSE